MTCIAWDGKTLAADKRVSYQGLSCTVTKIFMVFDFLVGVSGNGPQGMEMIEWLRSGAKPETFPKSQREEDQWATVAVFRHGAIDVYERTPYPLRVEDAIFATGCGRDYALAAMYLGKSAREAVEIACIFDSGCGNGVDTLELP